MKGNSYWKYLIPGTKEFNSTASILIENLWPHYFPKKKWPCLCKLESTGLHLPKAVWTRDSKGYEVHFK